MNSYRYLVRPVLFRTNPEWTHDTSIRVAELAGRWSAARRLLAAHYVHHDPALELDVAGVRFASPLGLAAGYDKSARAYPLLAALGFSHVEVGSVSAMPSAGNPRPRLFRLPHHDAIVVHYGVPNDGATRVAQRLIRRPPSVPLGVNVVNTNHGPHAPPATDDAVIEDYVTTATRLAPHADYLCLNLSCPNTVHSQGFFADTARLRTLLTKLSEPDLGTPVFLKVAPFEDLDALERFLAAVDGFGIVSGFAVNLPSSTPAGVTLPSGMTGAVSGPPVETLVNATIRELYRRMPRNRYAIIGAGGVRSAEDAYRKIRLGASLVQLLTALIYHGPGVASQIARNLPALLARDGVTRICEVIGVDGNC
ncbi:MAG TPA: quinone-dependent dihydroorotate dehydrogenase [Pseudonocardiaceae bacterium]|nr:quinone-dependent dihydroorotate dehydrogenase [Pseudonocardiaceae bacterium]